MAIKKKTKKREVKAIVAEEKEIVPEQKINGRPLLFKSVEELEQKINDYFDYCDTSIIKKIINKNNEVIAEIARPYTITGLAAYLNTSRRTLINYEEKEKFFHTVKKAKARIEAEYEERGLIGDSNATMTIFTLKNNFDWQDKSQTDITTKGKELPSSQILVLNELEKENYLNELKKLEE